MPTSGRIRTLDITSSLTPSAQRGRPACGASPPLRAAIGPSVNYVPAIKMNGAQLLAVVEVPRDDRVRCQANGCNHPVFRRIHVVRQDSVVQVCGSACFKKLFAGLPVASATPRYTTTEGRHLTDEERQLLIENTERLIQQFEAELQEERIRMAASDAARSVPPPVKSALAPPAPAVPSPAARQAAELQAKQNVRSKYQVDPELPGWHALVLMEIERLLRQNAGS